MCDVRPGAFMDAGNSKSCLHDCGLSSLPIAPSLLSLKVGIFSYELFNLSNSVRIYNLFMLFECILNV